MKFLSLHIGKFLLLIVEPNESLLSILKDSPAILRSEMEKMGGFLIQIRISIR